MNVQGVMALLEKNKNERGIEHWKRLTGGKKGTSFGIGLSQLRKLAKQIGRDHDLALKLWATGCYDAKVIAALIVNLLNTLLVSAPKAASAIPPPIAAPRPPSFFAFCINTTRTRQIDVTIKTNVRIPRRMFMRTGNPSERDGGCQCPGRRVGFRTAG